MLHVYLKLQRRVAVVRESLSGDGDANAEPFDKSQRENEPGKRGIPIVRNSVLSEILYGHLSVTAALLSNIPIFLPFFKVAVRYSK